MKNEKTRLVALLLWLFLWPFAAHRFYVGKWVSAIFFILTLGGFGIWALVDFIKIITGSFKDSSGNKIIKWVD